MHPKQIIIVLGSGRSGTSLVTHLLSNLGMSLSDNLVDASEQNPEGAFEDTTIFSLHSRLLNLIHGSTNLPIMDESFNATNVKTVRDEISAYVNDKISSSDSIWGFKDPRTSLFLKLWGNILNSNKIVPRYILTVRDPSDVVTSFSKQYSKDATIAELTWLLRTVNSLRHTGANVFIVHYEEMLSEKNTEISQGLLQYTGLNKYYHGNLVDTLKNVIKPQLNRSQWEPHSINNRWVRSLYDVLKECRGSEFDRSHLMASVKECQQAMDEFMGWPNAAHQILKKNNPQVSNLNNEIVNLNNEIVNLNNEIVNLIKENNSLLKLNITLSDQLVDHKILKQKVKQLQKEMTTVDNTGAAKKVIKKKTVTKESYAYRLGRVFVAISKNEKNAIIRAPVRLLILIWDVITRKGRKKQKNAISITSYEQSLRLKKSKSYLLGKLLIGALQSPKKLFRLPSNIKQLRYS